MTKESEGPDDSTYQMAGSASDSDRLVEMFKYALDKITEVVRYAVGPGGYQAGGDGDDQRPHAAGAPILTPDTSDSDVDPHEVFLGADFLRETSGMYDETDDAPFGLPGIKADA